MISVSKLSKHLFSFEMVAIRFQMQEQQSNNQTRFIYPYSYVFNVLSVE